MSGPVSPVFPVPPNPPPDLLPVWDAAAACAAIGGDLPMARELLEQLRAELPATLAVLRDHAAAGDWSAVATEAHRCAGGAAYCGVPALSAGLRALERSVLAGDAEHEAALAAVVHEIGRLLAFAP